jgi:chromosomal replication initiator protein
MYGNATYESWFKRLTPVAIQDSTLLLLSPTRFIREWIVTHYQSALLRCVQEHAPEVAHVEIMVRSSGEAIVATETEKQNNLPVAPLDTRYTFANFTVGASNQLAFAAAQAVAESVGALPSRNPLFLHGPVGSGKTHLMHAIAHHMRAASPQRKVVYLTAEQFMCWFVRALRAQDTLAFKEHFRSVDVLMIDDIQFIGGKEATQEEFLHTFNALLDQQRQLVIACDRAPSALLALEERMRSRLAWGLVADIQQPDYALRLGILRNKAAHLPLTLPEDVLAFIATRITASVRELEGALHKVAAQAVLCHQPVNITTTQDVLIDLLRAHERVVTIDEIQRKVAEYFGLRVTDLHSNRRMRALVRPRQIAMYLAKELTVRSFSQIGQHFGGRDHTTAMHAIRRVSTLIAHDPEVANDVSTLRRLLCL